MANRTAKPPKEHQFRPGQSGNISGRPKGLLTKDKVLAVLGRFSDMTRDQLQRVISDSQSSMLEIMVASIIVKAAKDGDATRLEFLLSRSIGRVTDKVEVTLPTPTIIKRRDGGQVELGAKLEDEED